ncbi:4-hydroxy-3-methylbut-2-enyl diphosphate reductase, partial [bacterium]
KEIHKIAMDMDKKGYRVIVIGDYKHDEVQGIVGQIKHRAIVLEDIGDIKKKIPRGLCRAAVVVQSTQNLNNVLKMQEMLKGYIKDLKFFNTICAPTRQKQEEIRVLPRENDCIIVIGSKTSANTKRLYQISRSINKNTHWVTSQQELKKAWFRDASCVAITAGASTPASTIQEVKDHIRKLRDWV